MPAIRTVLCPTDFSEASRTALDLARSLARDYGAELVILHVIPPALVVVPDGTALVPAGDPGLARRHLQETTPGRPSVTVRCQLAEGNAADEIVRVAGDARADLIVIGTHGRSGLSRLLMGSTAEEVVRKAPCPVVTVRPAANAPHAAPEPAAEPGGRREPAGAG